MKGRTVRTPLMLEDPVPPSKTDRSPGLEESGYRWGSLSGIEDYDGAVFSPVCIFTGPPWKEWHSRTAGIPGAQGRSCEVEDQCDWSDLQREDPTLQSTGSNCMAFCVR